MTTAAIRTLLFATLLLSPLAAAEDIGPTKFNEATVADLQAQMAAGTLTSVELTNFYITRILVLDQKGPGVNAVIELNPDALAMARDADALRRSGVVLGPLHGIPVLLKDNIDTGDKMQTTAGSFALFGMPALRDSTIAAKLRAGGAVILGKLPVLLLHQRVVGARRTGAQPVLHRSQCLRLQLRVRCGGGCQLRNGKYRLGDRRQHRLPRQR